MSKQPTSAPTASAVGPCPTVIQIVGRPGTGSLPSTIATPATPVTVRDIFGICTTIHRYPILSTKYYVMCKVYTGYRCTSGIEHGLCACTDDNSLTKARGLSLHTGAQTMLYLSRVLGQGDVSRTRIIAPTFFLSRLCPFEYFFQTFLYAS